MPIELSLTGDCDGNDAALNIVNTSRRARSESRPQSPKASAT